MFDSSVVVVVVVVVVVIIVTLENYLRCKATVWRMVFGLEWPLIVFVAYAWAF
jgi:hypothetical protein